MSQKPRLWRQFLIPALKDKLHTLIQIENEKRKSSEVRHLEFQCEQTPFSVITPPPLPHVTLPPTSSQKIGTVLSELLTFLFVRNTLQALAPLADAHIHPHESVLSSLNYSISDYLITLQPKTSMFLTCMEEVRGEDRRGRFLNVINISERLTLQLSANKCLFCVSVKICTVHFLPGNSEKIDCVNHPERNSQMNKKQLKTQTVCSNIWLLICICVVRIKRHTRNPCVIICKITHVWVATDCDGGLKCYFLCR